MRPYLVRVARLTWIGVGFLIGYGFKVLRTGEGSEGLLIVAIVCLAVGAAAWALLAVQSARRRLQGSSPVS